MTVDYAKLKVDDIKHMLVDEGRFNPEDIGKLETKGKAAWVALHSGRPEEADGPTAGPMGRRIPRSARAVEQTRQCLDAGDVGTTRPQQYRPT